MKRRISDSMVVDKRKEEETRVSAYRFVAAVKQTFSNNHETQTYNEFVRLVNEYKHCRIHYKTLVEKFKLLFSRHPHLLHHLFQVSTPHEVVPNNNIDQHVHEEEQVTSFWDKLLLYLHVHHQHLHTTLFQIIKAGKDGTKTLSDVHMEITSLYQQHQHLFANFAEYSPSSSAPAPQPNANPNPNPGDVATSEAIAFVHRIISRFGNNSETFKQFLLVLNMYRAQKISITGVYQQVAALFVLHPDLHDEFITFLPISGDVHSPPTNTSVLTETATSHDVTPSPPPPKKIKKAVSPAGAQTSLRSSCCRVIFEGNDNPSYRRRKHPVKQNQGPGELRALNGEVKFVRGDRSERNYSTRRISEYEENLYDCEAQRFELDLLVERLNSAAKQAEKLMDKLSEKFVEKSAAAEEAKEVVEKSSDQSMEKSVVEEAKQVTEKSSEESNKKSADAEEAKEVVEKSSDQSAEISVVEEAKQVIEKSSEESNKKSADAEEAKEVIEEVNEFYVKNHISEVSLVCIRRLYDDYGDDMVELVYKDPRAVLQVILPRLKQKREELLLLKKAYNEEWNKVQTLNHQKLMKLWSKGPA